MPSTSCPRCRRSFAGFTARINATDWRPFAAQLTRVEAAIYGMDSLAAVWLVNFTVVLPALNPAFVTLLPLWATLISKLLFGAAMTAVLLTSRYRRRITSTFTA
jgi:hypothetical protein